MNKQEIENYNRLCAEFLGWKYHPETANHGRRDNTWEYKPYYYHHKLKFHSDWNWIHEVVEKMRDTMNPKEHSNTTFSSLRREVQTHLGRSNKEAVVQAINQFLIWQNENKAD